MSKRFTATEKWEKQWYRLLPPRSKCLWQYLCDKCDGAGVWEPDFDLASFQIGEAVEEKDLITFGDRIRRLDSGKVHIVGFVEFQYGKLSAGCKAHNHIFTLITRHFGSHTHKDTLSHRVQEEDKEEETEKDKEPDKEKDDKAIASCDFSQFWDAYPRKTGKGAAEKAWSKLKPELAKVLAALAWQVKSAQWLKDNGQFIPHPATYLNQRRWEDEPEKPAKPERDSWT